MTGPFIPPTPGEIYEILPYHFPMVDPQPVLRIPVKGPAPFNTLAVVRTQVPVTNYRVSDGVLQRRTFTIPTKLVHKDFDPTEPDTVFDVVHSSTATLHMMEITDEVGFPTDDGNTKFQLAVDSIHSDSKFDETGRWCVTIDVADQLTDVFSAALAEISSWVLIRENKTSTPHSPFGPDVDE
ncbi:hypothetical protein [Mycolicibacterium sp.]|uniref:hypothetical protein n=1 Tax=Mycolicibacterium sp. TaxID=2320850 RepID=UPI0037C8AF0A